MKLQKDAKGKTTLPKSEGYKIITTVRRKEFRSDSEKKEMLRTHVWITVISEQQQMVFPSGTAGYNVIPA